MLRYDAVVFPFCVGDDDDDDDDAGGGDDGGPPAWTVDVFIALLGHAACTQTW